MPDESRQPIAPARVVPDNDGEKVFTHDHTSFLVASATRPNEFHKVEFHDSKVCPATCSCEWFQMGIPRLIAEGKLPESVEHRRCKHIRRVMMVLAGAMVEHLVKTDPSNPTKS